MSVTYRKAVNQNLEHMGTLASEWSAVPVEGVTEADTGDGKSVMMPVFLFPQSYADAPTLYKGECCNLCGTRIKNVYWIQNDKRRWIMPVGSECVTHFEDGQTGERLVKSVVWEKNACVLADLIELRGTLWKVYSKRISLGYGRFEYGIFPHSRPEKEAQRFYQAIKACAGKVNLDSGNAAISRWAKKNRETAEELITAIRLFMDAPGEAG